MKNMVKEDALPMLERFVELERNIGEAERNSSWMPKDEIEKMEARNIRVSGKYTYAAECVRLVEAMESGQVQSIERTTGSGQNLWLCSLSGGNGFAYGPDPVTAFVNTTTHW